MSQGMSTKLCNELLVTGSLKSIFIVGNSAELRIYSGAVPAHADDVITGTKIATVLGPSGAYLSFASTAAAGVLAKESATWEDPSAVGGVATHYRLVLHADDDSADSGFIYARIQGTVGSSGYNDMNVGSTTIAASSVFTVNTFTQSLQPN